MSSCSYPAPIIPETPSKTINSKLELHFSSPPTGACHAVLGKAVCGFFGAVVMVYTALTQNHPERNALHMWMASCAVAVVAVCLASWLSYSLIIAMSFVFHGVLYYGAVLLAMVAVGLGVAGAVVYKQDIGSGSGVSAKRGASYRAGTKAE